MEIVTSWQLQGREEGRQEGKLELVMRLLNRKIGLMAPDVEERIRNLTVTQLENLAEALLDFTTPEDLVNWLNQLDS
jgi:predicted transposase YdaD